MLCLNVMKIEWYEPLFSQGIGIASNQKFDYKSFYYQSIAHAHIARHCNLSIYEIMGGRIEYSTLSNPKDWGGLNFVDEDDSIKNVNQVDK